MLPALTISLIWENQTTFYTMARYGRMVIAQILMYFIMAAGGILGSRICHLSGTTSNVHRGCSVGGNYGFLVIPLIVYFISHHFLTNVESMILMLISAAPSMTTSSMIAEQYHLDEEYASTAVVTTTLFCMFIIPLLFGLISL